MFGLRRHAVLISVFLLLLTATLGGRAYLIARRHRNEVVDLYRKDAQAPVLLKGLEARATTLHQLNRKWRATDDPVYLELEAAQWQEARKEWQELREAVAEADSGLPSEFSPRALKSLRKVRQVIDESADRRLAKANEEIRDIAGLVLLSVLLLAGVSAWLVLLFFRGLLEPLRRLRAATDEISTGRFSHQVAPSGLAVAELRQLSESFNSMVKQLDTLDRAKSEFLQTISHELKNPLAALKEGMSLLVNQGEQLPAASRQKGLNACLIATRRLETMINNLLKISRGDASPYDMEVSLRRFDSAIQAAVDEVRPLAERRRMSLSFNREGGREEGIQAAFNWDGMVQVFVNVLQNAIKYGQEGSVIEVSATEKKGAAPRIEAEIANTGKPVASLELTRIFDRFYRGANAAHQQGLGIGLHVVKQIVTAHRGEVSAESSGGQTRIRLWIPGVV